MVLMTKEASTSIASDYFLSSSQHDDFFFLEYKKGIPKTERKTVQSVLFLNFVLVTQMAVPLLLHQIPVRGGTPGAAAAAS